ncbi:MAG TPA: ABC transporter permease [Gemmatimonadaceae bacterium]|nr:ABC transporter permease [Gemmatimonadaceae bacterium]
MSAFGRGRAWLRAVLQRRRLEREMQEEMAAHIAQATDRFMARGMKRDDALRAARREFGSLGVIQEDARDARGGQWIDGIRRDLKYALRYFVRTPLTTVTIVLTLALGIGFSSAGFSIIHGILRRPAPGVPDDPALVKIRGISSERPFARRLSYPELAAYAALTDKFSSVVGWVMSGVVVNTGGPDVGAMSARAYFVTPNYFPTLGVRLAAGRGFDQSRFDQRAPPELSAIISDAIAVERFGGARGALGKRLEVNDVTVTIVGVVHPRFRGPVHSGETRNLWLPLSTWQMIENVKPEAFTDPNAAAFEGLARLRSGVTLEDALPAVRLVAARADGEARARAPRRATARADIVPLRGVIPVTGRYDNDLPTALAAGTTITLLILLVCTTTVSSLLLGAAVARRYEIGVRLALGASRRRVIRQLLTEIGLLALAGGALALWAFNAISRFTEVAQDGFDVSPSWAAVVFTVAYAVLTAVLCGLSPALHATRTGVSDVLKDSATSTTSRSRLQQTFVVAQIAIAQPLMVALAAVIVSVVDDIPSIDDLALRDQVLVAEFATGLKPGEPDRMPRLMERFAGVPGVIAVLPKGYGEGSATLEQPSAAGSTGERELRAPFRVDVVNVPPGYFRAFDIPIVRGRDFVASDTTAGVTPVIITDSLAAELFRGADPIGRRLRRVGAVRREVSAEGGMILFDGQQATEVEVVGVARVDRDRNTLDYPGELPPMFVPFRRTWEGRLLVRTNGPAEAFIPAFLAIARDEARLVPVYRMRTLGEGDRLRRSSRLQATAFAAGCGAIALILASVGLYAMVSVAVGHRRREIGIRIALGAGRRRVVRMFFAGGLRTSLFGLVLGLPLSAAALGIVRRETNLVGIEIIGLAVLVALAVVAVASLASWLPARRAAVVDPMVALRAE